MANGCEDCPAAVSTLNVGEATSLGGMPLINAHGSLACDVAAAETGENFVYSVHSILILQLNYFATSWQAEFLISFKLQIL
jgi:hypothetical protein